MLSDFYYIRSWKNTFFIITPDELRDVLHGFHHIVIDSGVSKEYTESDPAAFFSKYDDLYNKLRNGDKLYRPSVRVSTQGKRDLANFYFITHNAAKIL